MSPLFINMMLAYHCRPDPSKAFSQDEWESSAMDLAKNLAESEGLICVTPAGREITEKGRAYIDFLCSVSLPAVSYRCEFEPGQQAETNFHGGGHD